MIGQKHEQQSVTEECSAPVRRARTWLLRLCHHAKALRDEVGDRGEAAGFVPGRTRARTQPAGRAQNPTPVLLRHHCPQGIAQFLNTALQGMSAIDGAQFIEIRGEAFTCDPRLWSDALVERALFLQPEKK